MKANVSTGPAATLGNLSCTLVITCTLGGLFGYYAFGSPDNFSTCYFTNGEAYPIMQENTDSLDVGKRFHIFFLLGFCLMVL